MQKISRLIGLIFLFSALAIFISTLFLNKYRLTKDILMHSISNEAQYDLMESEIIHMLDKTYDSKFVFISEFASASDRLNARLRAEQMWDKVFYGRKDLYFHITKEASFGSVSDNSGLIALLTFVLGVIGALMYILPSLRAGPAGIKNNNIQFDSLNSRGIAGIVLGTFLIGFYVVLYWYPAYIAEWALILEPLSQLISGGEASQWFLYGTIYTLAILVMGTRFLIKYRHSNYQMARTASVMFFQTILAFLLPHFLMLFNLPYMDLKNMWPLDYTFFFDWRLNEYIGAGTIGYFMMGWGIALFAVGVPGITYFYGKRWYCSWVCGCGGLAETAGDPFRQQSNKTLKAWQIERWLVHAVLVFAVVMTAAVLYTFYSGKTYMLGLSSYDIREWYGFGVGSIFAGVVGTGFYPLMGNRVWCRFGCPLAAYLGLIQKFKSRFRITTNGGQCISCGNCSTYCEMGIDVRWYAQRGQNIIRSSCVGCGICAAVCPRGVLALENGPEEGRYNGDVLNNPISVGRDEVGIL